MCPVKPNSMSTTALLLGLLVGTASTACNAKLSRESMDGSDAPSQDTWEAPTGACGTGFPKHTAYLRCPESQFCDESSGTCQDPVTNCHSGFCFVPAASFLMDFEHEVDYSKIPTSHLVVPDTPVAVTRNYEMMETEVTYGHWAEVMPSQHESPKELHCTDDTCPVRDLTLWAMFEYANRLSVQRGLERCYELYGCVGPPIGDLREDWSEFHCDLAEFIGPDCEGYRLPSLPEWEHAARAGTNTCTWKGPHSDNSVDPCRPDELLTYIGWFCGNSDDDSISPGTEACYPCNHRVGESFCCEVHPVARLEPNPFGLYDVIGNVRKLIPTVEEDLEQDSHPFRFHSIG